MAKNLYVSLMRTLVPLLAGLALSAAARVGMDVDDATVTTYVTAGLTLAYYAAFRGLEELAERMAWRHLQLAAGVLLGWARPPAYEKPPVLPRRFKLDMDAMHGDLAALKRVLGIDGEDRR